MGVVAARFFYTPSPTLPRFAGEGGFGGDSGGGCCFRREAVRQGAPYGGFYIHLSAQCVCIAIHRKPHTVLRRLAVQPRTVFGDAPCLKLSVDGYKWGGCMGVVAVRFFLLAPPQPSPTGEGAVR